MLQGLSCTEPARRVPMAQARHQVYRLRPCTALAERQLQLLQHADISKCLAQLQVQKNRAPSLLSDHSWREHELDSQSKPSRCCLACQHSGTLTCARHQLAQGNRGKAGKGEAHLRSQLETLRPGGWRGGAQHAADLVQLVHLYAEETGSARLSPDSRFESSQLSIMALGQVASVVPLCAQQGCALQGLQPGRSADSAAG